MNREKERRPNGKVLLRPMQLNDVPVVAAIDKVSFPTPWSETTYRQELRGNPAAYLYVAEIRSELKGRAEIVGYVGFWHIVDEVHISTIAVRPERRRQGFGRGILKFALEKAHALGAELATLEVRESNTEAIELYREFGFELKGRRPRYYRDTDEDALVMFKENLDLHQQEAREKIGER
jgi:ribosomal-protein-alanine N-acetyltransferase